MSRTLSQIAFLGFVVVITAIVLWRFPALDFGLDFLSSVALVLLLGPPTFLTLGIDGWSVGVYSLEVAGTAFCLWRGIDSARIRSGYLVLAVVIWVASGALTLFATST